MAVQFVMKIALPDHMGLISGFPRSCEAYNALPKCCQSKVLVHMDCVDGGLS